MEGDGSWAEGDVKNYGKLKYHKWINVEEITNEKPNELFNTNYFSRFF